LFGIAALGISDPGRDFFFQMIKFQNNDFKKYSIICLNTMPLHGSIKIGWIRQYQECSKSLAKLLKTFKLPLFSMSASLNNL
jgi:hypothetical protein